MKNIEKYKDKINSGIDFCDLFYDISLIKHGKYSPCDGKCKKCCDECIKWLAEECKESILDDVERKYLSSLLKPFKSDVVSINKIKTGKCKAFLFIKVNGYNSFSLPSFESGKMYRNMELNKEYTLRNLDCEERNK